MHEENVALVLVAIIAGKHKYVPGNMKRPSVIRSVQGGSVRLTVTSRAIARVASLESVLQVGDWAKEGTVRRLMLNRLLSFFHDTVLS